MANHLFDLQTFKSEWEKDQYICTHYGENPSEHHRSVVPPIYESSLHVYEDFQSFVDAQKDEQSNYLYWRGTNPTVEIAERKIAALERGEKCKCFTSGMAAITAAVLTYLKAGDHFLTIGNIYGTSFKLANYLQDKWKIEHTAVINTSIEHIEQAIKPNTRVILLESPTSMTFQLIEVEAVVDLARKHNIITIFDNTWATPLFQKPLEMGIDIVVHSAAKYLSGHSDILAGAVVSDETTIKQVFENEFTIFGGALAPYEAWLLIRGLRTLPIRMKQHEANGKKIASFLDNHSSVRKVNYPGLTSHSDFDLGMNQLSGYSSVLSFELVENSYEMVKKVIDKLKLFQIGYSFGSYESLVLSENNGENMTELKKRGIDPGTIRLSIGLEEVDLLIRDLEEALSVE